MIIGSTISHYKIVAKLGEGGMGVVYKAEDTKLNRQVALKFLAEHLLSDPEAKERFLREAQAAAALHHPNVCPVHEIDEVEGKTFIAMAFLEGESLEDLIAKGPLSLKESLDIARQVADGLQAAHAKNVVHRDIKPANILVSPEGRPTIMDFGLARLTEASRLTKVDTAMGTVAYMSPEQAQGMEVDSRSDLWSLGCALYEMVSGQRPFRGVYDQALLYEIVHEEPAPLTGLRTGVPIELELLASKCLAKDREDRYQSAKEIAVDLRTLAEKLKSGRSTVLRAGAVPATMTAAHTLNPAEALPPDAVVVAKRKLQVVYGLFALVAIALLGVSFAYFTQTPPAAPSQTTRRFSLSPEGVTAAGISPDGRYIAYTVGTPPESSLWLRAIGSETARQIPGTEGARAVVSGWSPDSQAIVFATTAEVKRVAIGGGDPVKLADLPGAGNQGFRGVTWSPEGERIVFSSTGGALYEIPARGGEPQIVAGVMGGGFVEPHFLPTDGDSEALLYESSSQIWVANLETGESSEIGPGSAPVYSRDGYLIHGSADPGDPRLFALPFSLATLQATGEPFPIADGSQSANVAQDGTLVFLDGARSAGLYTLVWRHRAGELLETIGQPQPTMYLPALSPDGQRVAVTSNESGNADIWIHDLARSTKNRLTFDEATESNPSWSPSGREVAYAFNGEDGYRLLSAAVDGTGEPTVLLESEIPVNLPGYSRDGRFLVYDGDVPGASRDIFYLEFGTDGAATEPVKFLGTPAAETGPTLSPDGRFVAYYSDESGRVEIYVSPFPGGAGKRQVSVNGGRNPRWRSDGSELYYIEGRSTLMAVPLSTDPGVTFGQPQALIEEVSSGAGGRGAQYDVSPDGQRFVTIEPVEAGAEEAAASKIRIVENWSEEFRNRRRD